MRSGAINFPRVVPAKAGTHTPCPLDRLRRPGPRLRGDDCGLVLLPSPSSCWPIPKPPPKPHRPRRGGGAGGARGADRRRCAQARRQCGRCRGRDRFRHGGDLSARRQSRGRRIHADPSRRSATRRRDRLSRDRAGGGDPRHVPRLGTARPIRASRAIRRSAIGVPGTVAGLALAQARYGSGKFSLADLIAPAIELARDGHADRGGRRRIAAGRGAPPGALAVDGEDFPQGRRAGARTRRPAGAERSRRHLGRHRARRTARLL